MLSRNGHDFELGFSTGALDIGDHYLSINATDAETGLYSQISLNNGIAIAGPGSSLNFGTDSITSFSSEKGLGIEYLGNVQRGTFTDRTLIDKRYADSLAIVASFQTLQSVTNNGKTTTNDITAQRYIVSGTAGAGYISLPTQSSSPTGVSGQLQIYRNSAGNFTYNNGTNTRTFVVPRAVNRRILYPYARDTVTLADSALLVSTFVKLAGDTLKPNAVLRFKGYNAQINQYPTGEIQMKDVGANRSNWTFTANTFNPSQNPHVTADPNFRFVNYGDSHFGLNNGNTTNSAVAFNTNHSVTPDGLIELRSLNVQNAVNSSQYSRIMGSDNMIFNNFYSVTQTTGVGGYLFQDHLGRSLFQIDYNGDIFLGKRNSSPAVNFYDNSSTPVLINKIQSSPSTGLTLGSITSLPTNIQSNGTNRLTFSGAGVTTFVGAGSGIATLSTGVLSTTATTGSGNVVLASGAAMTSPTITTENWVTSSTGTGSGAQTLLSAINTSTTGNATIQAINNSGATMNIVNYGSAAVGNIFGIAKASWTMFQQETGGTPSGIVFGTRGPKPVWFGVSDAIQGGFASDTRFLLGSTTSDGVNRLQVTGSGIFSTNLTVSGLNTAGVVHNSSAGLLSTSLVSLTADVTGITPVVNGGSGFSTYATGDILYASGSFALSKRAIGTAGYVLTSVGGFPTWNNIYAGTTAWTAIQTLNAGLTSLAPIGLSSNFTSSINQLQWSDTGSGFNMNLLPQTGALTSNITVRMPAISGTLLTNNDTPRGQITLTAGANAVSVTGVTTSSKAFVALVSPGGTVTTTWQYKAVCTAGTVTISAITNTGTVNTTDTSLLNYFVTLN